MAIRPRAEAESARRTLTAIATSEIPFPDPGVVSYGQTSFDKGSED